MTDDPDDILEGCTVQLGLSDVPDDELPYVALAGGLEGEAAELRVDEYGALFAAGRF